MPLTNSGGITKAITATLTLDPTDNVITLSLLVVSGTCNVTGPAKFRGAPSDTISLSAGQSMTIPSNGGGCIAGWIFTPVGGTTNLLINL